MPLKTLLRLMAATLLPTLAQAQAAGPELSGAAAFGDWRSDAPGLQRLIRPQDLPRPFATHSASNGPQTAPMPADPHLQVPPGFAVSLFARGLDAPRELKRAPNGDIFVAETNAGTILVLPPGGPDKDRKPAAFATDLDGPFGMAFFPAKDPHWLYVATNIHILRFPYAAGDRAARGRPEIVARLDISDGGHFTRDLLFSADGQKLYVSIGSQSNDAEGLAPISDDERKRLPKGAVPGEETRRADVLAFDTSGKNGHVFATGLRNCVGLARPPASGDVYCATNERDGLGDDLPPDYVTRVREGGFYGWPWYYTGNHEDPGHTGERPDLAAEAITPDVLIQPHSAPLGLTFYDAPDGAVAAFPPAYRSDGFAALHGSWNRARRTGYKVVRIVMKDGVPTGAYEDFLIGFVNPDGRVWGRPVGVVTAADGALLVSEDQSGTIWRIAPQ
jgi:glucose/arabinose dehydrogenase